MSLAQVKSVIENFVQTDRNDLLVIKGNWGVGKTYFWQNLIKGLKKNNKIKADKYIYVSLFGINSLDSLKNLITASSLESKLKLDNDSQRDKSFFTDLPNKIQSLFKNIPYVNLIPINLVSDIAFLSLSNKTICFDDLERKGESINLKDILGLASQLKEQRNCKIIFILNQNSLIKKDSEEFQKYNEKVIDIELEFNPTSEETFGYIFEESDPYFDLIKSSCITLKIKNIRILQRIKRFVEDLLPQLIDIVEIVCKQIISSIILFVWSNYDKDNETVTTDFIENFSPAELYIRKKYKNETITKEEEEKYRLLSNYGYLYTDELDKELMNLVKKGYLAKNFFEELKKKNEEVIAQKGKSSYTDAWKLHRSSLNLDENEFIEELVSAFRSQKKYLSPSNLFEVVTLLRRYDRNILADELIDEFFLENVDYKTVSMMKRLPSYKEYENDVYFFKKLNEIKPPIEKFTFTEIINKLMKDQYLEESMLEFLASADVDEYYNYLKSDEVGEFYFPSKALLEYGNNSTDRHQAILDKTTRALKRIASESRINRNRITDWLEIEIDE